MDTTGTTATITVADGVELFRRSWPLPNAKANILIVHGYAEHCDRYEDAARRFNERGYGVYAYDHRGHGNSPGKLGQIPSFDALIDDLKLVVDAVRGEVNPAAPLFIWGHSMGGLVSTAFILRNQPDCTGIILTGPGVKSDENVSPFLKAIAGFLARFLPFLPVHTLDPTGVSRDQAEVDKYISDPRVYHGKILARTGHQLMKTIDFVEANFADFDLPVYILHGTKDRLVHYRAGEDMYAKIASTDKKLNLWEDAYHELHNDTIRDDFYAEILAWMDERC